VRLGTVVADKTTGLFVYDGLMSNMHTVGVRRGIERSEGETSEVCDINVTGAWYVYRYHTWISVVRRVVL